MTSSPLLTAAPASVAMPQSATSQSDRPGPPPTYYAPRAATPRSRGFGAPISDIDLTRARTQQSHHQQDTSAPAYTLTSNEPVPPSYGASKHGLFGSEDEYLAELRRWAESKQYASSGSQGLVGFYGTKTCADILNIDKTKVGLHRVPSSSAGGATIIPADFDPDDLYDDDEDEQEAKKQKKQHRRASSLVPSFLKRKKNTSEDK